MNIQSIYDHFNIPQHLQLHMLKVAWVCKIICDNWSGKPLDTRSLIQAALLHDMWNIVKFTFDKKTSTTILKWLDIEALKKTQKIMIEKYWSNDHDANILICKEIWVTKNVIELVDAIDFLSLHYLKPDTDMEKILMIYCDLRIWPFGVISTHERLHEAAIRYKQAQRVQHLESSFALADSQETSIFQYCSLTPEDITEDIVQELIQDLREFEIVIE